MTITIIAAISTFVEGISPPDVDNLTITDLMKELSEMDPSQWVERTIGYEVRE